MRNEPVETLQGLVPVEEPSQEPVELPPDYVLDYLEAL